MAELNGPAEIVQDAYQRSVAMADKAMTQLASFTAAMGATLYEPPTISVEWAAIPAPAIEALPAVPDVPIIQFKDPGNVPLPLDSDLGEIGEIDDFDVQVPALNYGDAPNITIGAVPKLPEIGAVVLPEVPEIVLPEAPETLTLTTPLFGGISLHSEYLEKLTELPELQLALPEKLDFKRPANYVSQLLENLKAVIDERVKGGTGLPTTVEQGIWDRARDREASALLGAETDAKRAAESLGFALPAGVLSSQLEQARRDYTSTLSALSRDIAIKQAELVQSNMHQAITHGIQLETQLMDYAQRDVQMVFDMAKSAAESAVQVHNAGVEHYKALLQGYSAYAQTYDTLMKGELAKIELYKAQLEGEQTKAQVNSALVQQYKAEIEASLAHVELYKAQVQGAQSLVEIEKAKLQAGGEQIRGFVAQLSAETAKIEAYKAGISAQATKAEAYKSQAQAYAAKVGAQGERARIQVARLQAMATAKSAEWDGYKARISAETSRIDALRIQTQAQSDAYRMGAAAITEKARLNASMWEASIRQYEAATNVTIQTARMNNEAMLATNNARQDMAKVGAQVYAQIAASAYNVVSTSAAISGSVTESISSEG
ncbi:hypothetical protein [Comamonas sp. NoAH]|uniref:hypothetical protein n=1 Tax=Comamonas halotolerans TaxID=3041496 RepID=UPI0024E1661C|nr:hypothetical protein [Comamonas sp. NoAH]